MTKVWLVHQEAVYRHVCGGVFLSYKEAVAGAILRCGYDYDEHHTWDVVEMTLGDPCSKETVVATLTREDQFDEPRKFEMDHRGSSSNPETLREPRTGPIRPYEIRLSRPGSTRKGRVVARHIQPFEAGLWAELGVPAGRDRLAHPEFTPATVRRAIEGLTPFDLYVSDTPHVARFWVDGKMVEERTFEPYRWFVDRRAPSLLKILVHPDRSITPANT